MVSVDTELSFDIITSSISHQYKDDWITAGYGDGCTISYRLEGSAANWSSITGDTVTVAPVSGIVPGEHDLRVVLYYSASTFGDQVPLASPTYEIEMTILAERNIGIEEWPLKTITALGAILIMQLVLILYFWCDSQRQEEYKSVQPDEYQFQTEELLARGKTTKINVIKLD